MRNPFKRHEYICSNQAVPNLLNEDPNTDIKNKDDYIKHQLRFIEREINKQSIRSVKSTFDTDIPRNVMKTYCVNGKEWQRDYFHYLAEKISSTDTFTAFLTDTLGLCNAKLRKPLSSISVLFEYLIEKTTTQRRYELLTEWFSSNDSLTSFIQSIINERPINPADIFHKLSDNYFLNFANANKAAYKTFTEQLYMQGTMVCYPLKAFFNACIIPQIALFDNTIVDNRIYAFTESCYQTILSIEFDDRISITGKMKYQFNSRHPAHQSIPLNAESTLSITLKKLRGQNYWEVILDEFRLEGSSTFIQLTESPYPSENFGLQKQLFLEADIASCSLTKFDDYVKNLLNETNDLSRLNLSHIYFSNFNFRKKNITGTIFTRNGLDGAKLNSDQIAQMLTAGRKILRNLDAEGEDFAKTGIVEAHDNLEAAKLDHTIEIDFNKINRARKSIQLENSSRSNIDFSNTDCSGSNFSGSSLQQIKFIGALLLGSIFDKSNLYYADFTNADLRDSSLRHIGLSNTQLKNIKINANTLLFGSGFANPAATQGINSKQNHQTLIEPQTILFFDSENQTEILADCYTTLMTLQALQENYSRSGGSISSKDLMAINQDMVARLTSSFELQNDNTHKPDNMLTNAIDQLAHSDMTKRFFLYNSGALERAWCVLHSNKNTAIMTIANLVSVNHTHQLNPACLSESIFQHTLHRMALSKNTILPDNRHLDCIQVRLVDEKHHHLQLALFKKDDRVLIARTITSIGKWDLMFNRENDFINTVKKLLRSERHHLAHLFGLDPNLVHIQYSLLNMEPQHFNSKNESSTTDISIKTIKLYLNEPNQINSDIKIKLLLPKTSPLVHQEELNSFSFVRQLPEKKQEEEHVQLSEHFEL